MPSSAARRAVPSLTTWLIMPAMSEATEAGIAWSGFLPSRATAQTRAPAAGAAGSRRGIGRGRRGAGPARHLGDLDAAGLGRVRRLAAERDRQFHRHDV